MEVALGDMGLDTAMISALHDILDFIDDGGAATEEKPHHPSRAYIRDAKAMKSTPADVIELPSSYNFVIDMPGLKSDQIKAHVEDGNVLVVSGERRQRRDKEEGAKYLRMERRLGKLLKKFMLPENADTEKISAVLEDGVLTVAVEKTPPPEPKKPKVIEVKCSGDGGAQPGGAQKEKRGGPEEMKTSDWHESEGSHGDAAKRGE